MHRVDAARLGIALLEVLVAMLLLGTAGAALVSVASQSMHTLTAYEVREQEVREASNVLSRLAVMRPSELRNWLGQREVGSLTVRTLSDERGLIEITIAAKASRGEVLRTTLYPSDDSFRGLR